MENRLHFTTRDKSTKAYWHEYVAITLQDEDYTKSNGVEGKYSWQNRSWQNYDYQKALLNALNLLGASKESMQIVEDASSYSDAVVKLHQSLELLDNDTGEYVDYRTIKL